MGYRVINGRIQFIGDFNVNTNVNNKTPQSKPKSEVDFKKILQDKLGPNRNEEFTISNHALDRLRNRGISLNEADMKNINEGINKAEKKGCKEIVMIYKDVALVTSIKNRTVITAMTKEKNEANVFTNIDGLVIL